MATSNLSCFVLNADFSPLSLFPPSRWSFEKTFRNFLKGCIIPLEHHDVTLRSPSFDYRPPSVVALKTYVKLPQFVTFSRRNIFLRDDFRCQYCGVRFPSNELTFDHVIPQSRGGPSSFTNIVSACVPCNSKKGDRMDIKPMRAPVVPTPWSLRKSRPPGEKLERSLIDYMYWSGELERD